MRTKLLLSSISVVLLFTTGCGSSPELVDETQKNENATTVQESTAKATQKEDTSVVASSDATQSQDQNEIKMDTEEEKIKTIYFDYDKFTIRSDMRETLEKNSEILSKDESKNFRIKVEGNCDEHGSDEYNYALGLKRATKTKEALIAQGIKEKRITVISFGEANPTPDCTASTPECWAKNRRVDFKLLP